MENFIFCAGVFGFSFCAVNWMFLKQILKRMFDITVASQKTNYGILH